MTVKKIISDEIEALNVFYSSDILNGFDLEDVIEYEIGLGIETYETRF